jgi:hypothetical protein
LRTGCCFADGAAVFFVLILFGVVGWVYLQSIKGVSRNPTRRLLNYFAAFVFVVSLPRWVVFYVGSRPDSRDTFFCVAKRKYPKKRPPHAALIRRSEAFERAYPPKPSGARRCIRGLNPSR